MKEFMKSVAFTCNKKNKKSYYLKRWQKTESLINNVNNFTIMLLYILNVYLNLINKLFIFS